MGGGRMWARTHLVMGSDGTSTSPRAWHRAISRASRADAPPRDGAPRDGASAPRLDITFARGDIPNCGETCHRTRTVKGLEPAPEPRNRIINWYKLPL